MEEAIATERLRIILRALVMNMLVNDYAVERVAFGYEKPGDQVPIDLYLKHLRISNRNGDIQGVYIDWQECIRTELDYDGYVRELFVYQMEGIFEDAPKDIQLENSGEEIPLMPRFREYVFGLLPLFAEVLSVDVEYSVFDLISINKEARAVEYPQWIEFVTAILLKPLRAGSRIDKYVKDLSNPPYYVRRLIEKKGQNFYLKISDINSYEYIFALFSLMIFTNDENGKIFELKMREWERRHKAANV